MGSVLVWLRTHHVDRPAPQLWHEPFVGTAYSEPRVITRHKLTEAEATMSLASLAVLYPAPAPKEE